jgi:REP element-mobilizing transposase RayT
MALPRSNYVLDGQEGVYHCFSRCVRRAFLYGFDVLSGRDFSHRKTWIVDRLRHLAAIFAIDVCAYAVMENHYHAILRTRPDLVAAWSDREVATRWLTLFPKRRIRTASNASAEEEISALTVCPDRIANLRQRLSSLSWFMGRLNEFIARAANKEDKVKGRFWEARFKCQALLDEAAIAACMVYVDLNPIRAGLAAAPEECDFASIQQRICAWQKHITASRMAAVSADPENASSGPFPGSIPGVSSSLDDAALWLCPIQSDSLRRGILSMSTAEYFDLVDKSGRMTRSDKRGAIETDLAPILLRIGVNPEAWIDTVSGFGAKFRLAAGLLPNLRKFADQLGRRWLSGVTSARAAFTTSPMQPA